MEKPAARIRPVVVVAKRHQRIPDAAVVILTQRKAAVAAVKITQQRVAVRKRLLQMRTVRAVAVAVVAADMGKEC